MSVLIGRWRWPHQRIVQTRDYTDIDGYLGHQSSVSANFEQVAEMKTPHLCGAMALSVVEENASFSATEVGRHKSRLASLQPDVKSGMQREKSQRMVIRRSPSTGD